MNLPQNPKDITGLQKVPLHLVPPASTIYQALSMADGAKKYGPYNWRENAVIASIYVSAARRHLDAWFDGEELAQDSGVPHLGHALSCLGIIVDALETGNLIDDRPSPGPTSRLLEQFTKKGGNSATAEVSGFDLVHPRRKSPSGRPGKPSQPDTE